MRRSAIPVMPFLSQGDIPHLLHSYGYWAVAAIIALESMAIPLPGEATLIAAAIVAGTSHELDIAFVIAAAAIGATLGDNIGFWLGRELGYRLVLRYGRSIGLDESRIKLGQYLFLRHGGAIVFFGRFVSLLRAFAAFIAGANRMSWPRFLAFNAGGALLWSLLYGSGAYYLGKEARHLAGPIGIIIGGVAAMAILAAVFYLRRHEGALEAEAEKALPGGLAPLRKMRRKKRGMGSLG
jgi:membrane protein DedA with SNARE-associated domain